MKKIIFLSLFLIVSFSNVNAQAKRTSIISLSASVKSYHEKSQLEAMQKGPLLELYVERIRVLINTLPYIALTTKPGVTIQDVGIPDNSENNKMLALQAENTKTFLETTVAFQRTMMPYSDKGNIITSILYYESMLKELNQMNE
ncbi:hypothetical protein [Flavobacterium sp.]|uniref:hypothetical protein n=1 Tax=Flavobacterium sp. TaxID=239 RepID=UPI00286E806B|nr:hypothetical protein [Flavobacterium sp.]